MSEGGNVKIKLLARIKRMMRPVKTAKDFNREHEAERRRKQIAAGTLTESNGLVRGGRPV